MDDAQLMLRDRVRETLPRLAEAQVDDLARIVARIVETLNPERVFVFGSQARGEATADSDIDLLVVVPPTEEPSYRLAQRAYHSLHHYLTPLDIVVIPKDEFERRSNARASLPATVL